MKLMPDKGVDRQRKNWSVTMNANERRMLDDGDDFRTLQDDELCTVAGGVGYEGTPVVTYSVINAWPKKYTGVG